jgi:asparagine synthase (glutamine-hydrolysing)
MKLQLGLLHLDGLPFVPDDLARILGQFASHVAETAGEIADGSLVMAYRGDQIAFEDGFETQPFESGPYVLTWDGRLDNREELGRRLGLKGLNNVSDPAIVLRAYAAFGERVFNDLIGEFALALWCRTTRSLQFARSACGARTLYYVLNKNSLIWSSDFAHLVRISGVDLAVNDDYLLQYLVGQPLAKHTPLANVDAVPPNRITHFENGRFKFMRELWNPTHISPLRYRTDQDYEEHCREKINEAVQARLRAKHPIFAELSGGLDSSTVVLTADQILRARNQSPRDLRTVSCVYEESRTCDERPFIRAVEEKRKVDTLLVHEQDQRVTLGLEDPIFTGLPNPLHCFPGRYQTVAAIMRQHKARVLLTGGGGDHLFWSEPDGAPIVADELRKANIFRAHKECITWSRAAHIPYYEMLVSRSLPLVFESLLLRNSLYKQPGIPTWVRPKYRGTVLSLELGFDRYATWCSTPSRRARAFAIDNMFRQLGAGVFQEYSDLFVSHPYSHRPLIEFCLAAPASQFLREGQTRSLMRRCLRDLLPRKTANRVSKGLVDETIIKALHRKWDSTANLMSWQVCDRGYVSYAPLLECLRKARLGILGLSGALFRLFSLERWLRSLSQVSSKQTALRIG